MRAAAKATLNAGYSHFKMSDSRTGSGSESVGVMCGGGPNLVSCNSVEKPHASAGATVTMFRASDPEARNAFDARRVLAQYAD